MSATLTILPIPHSMTACRSWRIWTVNCQQSDVEVQQIEETAAWVQWFLAILPQLGQQLSGTHRAHAIKESDFEVVEIEETAEWVQ